MVLDFLEQYWDALVMMTAEMAPYLLLGFLIAGLRKVFVPKTLYAKHLAPNNMKSVVKAAAIGVPLPLCSCGVIPTTVGLRKEGASHGACTSFLIATPQTGVDSIIATYSLMGLPFAIVRPVAALFTAMFGGWLVNREKTETPSPLPLKGESGHHEGGEEDEHEHCGCHHHHHHHHEGDHSLPLREGEGRVSQVLTYAFVEMMQDVGKWLVVGLLIAALITVAVPNEWLAALHDYKLLNMLIVLAVAIPMYVCATGSIPIAVSLMAKGLTPGAALVLLMAGPAVNSASMLVIGKVFGKRTLTLYLMAIIVGAIAFGLGIDYLLPQEWFAVQSGIADLGGECAHNLSVMDWVWIVLLVGLLMNAFWQQYRPTPDPSREGGEACGMEEEEEHCHCGHHHHHSHGHHSHNHYIHDNAQPTPLPDRRGSGVGLLSLYKISGMSCNHCKANVERAIRSVEGVEDVEVNLARGEAVVRGEHDAAAVIEKVKSYGYEAAEEK